MKNKLSRMTSAIVLSTLLLVFALSVAPSIGRADAEIEVGGGSGVWDQVCCGSHCTPSDYCIGTGPYTCCK